MNHKFYNQGFISKDKVKNALTLYDVASHYTQVKTKGKLTYFLCPFHDDQHIGSAYFYNDGDHFICHACGVEGDVLKLLSGFTQIPLSEMNSLLECAVRDFGLNREQFLNDDLQPLPKDSHSYPLTETEHFLLFGPVCEKVGYQNTLSYSAVKQNCKMNYEKFQNDVCLGSRIFFRYAVEKLSEYEIFHDSKEAQWDEINLMVLLKDTGIKDLFSDIDKSDVGDMERLLNAIEQSPFNIVDFWKAVISTQLKLLKKVLSPSMYKKELHLREQLYLKKYSIKRTVKELIKSQKEGL